MSKVQSLDPLAILKELEDLCRGSASGHPRDADAGSEWSGIAFRVGRDCLVSQLGEVVEVLEFPVLSRVPRTRSWVLGIANVRGNLLPVIDLGGYLGGEATAPGSRTRVLVIDHDGFYTGLVVDEVFGIRHFLQEEYTASDSTAAGYLRPYLKNGFRRGEQVWNIFNLHDLVLEPGFLRTAV
jgi:twitching motility protein PilI